MRLSYFYCLFFCAVIQAPSLCDLLSYVQRQEECFNWEVVGKEEVSGTQIFRLQLVSQQWHGVNWKHKISVYIPTDLKYRNVMGMLITGSGFSKGDDVYGALTSNLLKAPLAFLYDIPNQPLFGGLYEDDLIAHTFSEYLKTGDETLPLLLPMVKSAVKAMDAIQAFMKQQFGFAPEGFVITGASKRGWTTWLTAACDKRVKGIVPIVFDNLNFFVQMPHQVKMFGRFSEMIDEYTKRGLMEHMNSERGKRLVKLVDPYFYRQKFTMPKLIVNATNDRYWAVDALNFYWDELPGEKWVLYVPNAGHSLEGNYEKVIMALVAFFHHVAGGAPFPKMRWQHDSDGKKLSLKLASKPAPTNVTIWFANSPTTDFRDAKWVPIPAKLNEATNEYVGEIDIPEKGYAAMFGEAHFNINGISFSLTTTLRISPKVE